jgi:hypothetical protein
VKGERAEMYTILGREAPARGEAIGGWRRGRFVILVPRMIGLVDGGVVSGG